MKQTEVNQTAPDANSIQADSDRTSTAVRKKSRRRRLPSW
jgi:hypothetical protein